MTVLAKFAIATAIAGVAATVGDEVPKAMPVINVMLEEPLYGYADAMRASQYKASEAKLAALKGMMDSTKASTANMIRASSAQAAKAASMGSFLTNPENRVFDKLDDASIKVIETTLNQDCGEPCIKFFRQLTKKMEGKDSKDWQTSLVGMMQGEYQKVQNVYKSEIETSKLAKTFLKHKAKFNIADVPCGDGVSCKLAELVANKCEFGRIATMATYQAVNLAVHVFAIVINTLCLCIHVASEGVCVLANKPFPIPAICDFPYDVFVGLDKASKQIWESGIKGTTKMCKMIGDFRVADPLP